MSDLRYVKAREKFLNYAYDIFKPYYAEHDEFVRQFDKLPDDETKNHFLRITSFYKLLVRDGRFKTTDPKLPDYTDYLDETVRYVALISLIEAIYTTDEYQDFYEWLALRAKAGGVNIAGAKDLHQIHELYLKQHGLTQKVVRFFAGLPERAQKEILGDLKVAGAEKSIAQLARVLYDLRSKFVHQADLVLEVGDGIMISHRDKKIIVSALTLEQLQKIFEIGTLTFFGFEGANF
jgi:hypothetical protein